MLVVLGVLILAVAGAVIGVTMNGSKSPAGGSSPQALRAPHATLAAPSCPLTGTPSPSGSVPARPALAIKVDNYPTARPQSGLEKADVVFEEPVEGGVTRYVAVFQCQDASLVGPIRSARYPDVGILDLLNHPIFVHVGGIDPIQQMVRNADDDDYDLYYEGSIIQHPSGRVAPFDTYVSTAAAWGANRSDTSVPSPLFSYSPAAPKGTPVASVHIPFSGTSNETWAWSPTAKAWMLSYSGVASITNSGVPVSAANVVIEHVVTTTGPWLENDVGGYEVEVTSAGSGQLQVLRNGEMVTGTWQRSGLRSPLQLLSSAGTPLTLQPGNTWVELVPDSINVGSS
ncbi:MAG TPA: DUF3048 domain-containing protein [Acidimicrobiales bacterium]|nr:DUF3048 domain-containing protein [Acidimicrobiales bacterium]